MRLRERSQTGDLYRLKNIVRFIKEYISKVGIPILGIERIEHGGLHNTLWTNVIKN